MTDDERAEAETEGRMSMAEFLPCYFNYVIEFVKEIEAEAWFRSLPEPPGKCPCPRCSILREANSPLAVNR